MKKILVKSISIAMLVISLITSSVSAVAYNDPINEYIVNTKRDLLVLMISYPEHIKSVEKDDKGLVYVVMKSGKKILYDDKAEKNYNQKIFKADLQDTLEEPYILDAITEVREENKDPGRFREYTFLGEVYGYGEQSVRKNLENANTPYGNLIFNKQNSANANLTKSMNEAKQLAEKKPSVGGFVYPTCGTFNYRVVQDTGLLSPHSFGIAIDLNKNDSDYWKWVSKDKGSKRIAEYPDELVKIFENNGFVWGGKWAHFDILHFEYRPELILKAKYFNNKTTNNAEDWYKGAPETSEVDSLIKLINQKLDT